MTKELRKLLALFVALGMIALTGQRLFAQEAAAAEEVTLDETDEKDIPNKLLRLMNMEEGFKQALRKSNLYQRFIIQERAKLENTEDEEEKAKITENLKKAATQLQTVSVAMSVIFGVNPRRLVYQYDEVTSTVFLRVGTVSEAFARAVQTRNALQQFVIKKKAELEAEEKEEEKTALEAQIKNATKQWQIVAASLQVIYKVNMKRSYEFNPQNATLYLKVSDNEVEELKAKAAELAREREAAAAAAADE